MFAPSRESETKLADDLQALSAGAPLAGAADFSLWEVDGAPSMTAIAAWKTPGERPGKQEEQAVACALAQWAQRVAPSVSKFMLMRRVGGSRPQAEAVFLQRVSGEMGTMDLQVGANCGNSMTAVAACAMQEGDAGSEWLVSHRTTGLGLNFSDGAWTDGVFSAQVSLRHGAGAVPIVRSWPVQVAASVVNARLTEAFNPYLLFDRDALAPVLGAPNDTTVIPSSWLPALEEARRVARLQLLACPRVSANHELPKLCVHHRDVKGRLRARSIYRGQWHPRLPLTCLATLAAAHAWDRRSRPVHDDESALEVHDGTTLYRVHSALDPQGVLSIDFGRRTARRVV